MFRTHTCGELRVSDVKSHATLSGWVQRIRNKGGMVWVDLRDRYGITQLVFEEGKTSDELLDAAKKLGREFVIQASGKVGERYAKNDKLTTGEIELLVEDLTILNASKVPPFLIEDETDGGEDLRMKYRYLDLRRNPVHNALQLRHKMMQKTRQYMDQQDFLEVETPVLIKSTPEGARDFVVPSRMNPGQFYALPQSPQTFKQLLMVSGFDKYYQMVKCFRDEDLRADRQPEFTQIDCEMSFVEQKDVLNTFEGLIRYLFNEVKGVEIGAVPQMDYADAIRFYGSDKPDTRFDMQFVELNEVARGNRFSVFDESELIVGINAKGAGHYTRKQLGALTDFVRKPQVGTQGLVYVKCNADGSYKSSVDKFYSQENLKTWADKMDATSGDLLLILSGKTDKTRTALNMLRLHMGSELGLINSNEFKLLWVVDFPLFEWDEESNRFHAMHHPFTSPHKKDIALLNTDPGAVKANAYDLVINGMEVGGGSIRIHDRETQALIFKHLGFTKEEVQAQFGFLMEAFEYGAPPHGGLAIGFDRLCSLFGGSDSIRDYIAFPKNNSGRDVMMDSPSPISDFQLNELSIRVKK